MVAEGLLAASGSPLNPPRFTFLSLSLSLSTMVITFSLARYKTLVSVPRDNGMTAAYHVHFHIS